MNRILDAVLALFFISGILFFTYGIYKINKGEALNQVYNGSVNYKTDSLLYTNYCGKEGIVYNGKRIK